MMEDKEIIDRINQGDKDQEDEISNLNTRVTVLETEKETTEDVEEDSQESSQRSFQNKYYIITLIIAVASFILGAISQLHIHF